MRVAPVLLCALLSGCRSSPQDVGEAPPAQVSVPIEACASESPVLMRDLPVKVAGFCMPAGADVRHFTVGQERGLAAICTELFDGECELYRSYGLESVRVGRYQSAQGGRAMVAVTLTEFTRPTGAFGFFQRRALGDGHPSQSPLRALSVPIGRVFLGSSVAYVWRGRSVVEFTYLDEMATPDAIRAAGQSLLPELARATVGSLTGTSSLPYVAEFLEREPLHPMGVLPLPDGVLGWEGTGDGAIAYASGPEARYKIVLFARPDEAGAKDVLHVVQRALSAPPLTKKTRWVRGRRVRDGFAPESWIFAREGRVVLGVGPDEEAPDSLTESQAESILNKLLARSVHEPPPVLR